MKKLLFMTLLALSFSLPQTALAQEAPDMNANSPAITELKTAMRDRFTQIRPLLENGTLGFKEDGYLAVRDPASVPLAERQKISTLIAAQTRDRAALYREIARANGRPEWETDIAKTFAKRGQERMQVGWWYQDKNGVWIQKKAAN